MSKSMITHAAALKALSDLYAAVTSPYKTHADLSAALDLADAVLVATHRADPADVYCAAKQAKDQAKARLKAWRKE